MKVILKQDVRHLGRMGDMVNVTSGYARNFLFPRSLAAEATESRVKEFDHWQRVATSKKRNALDSKKDLIEALKKVHVTFKLNAGDADKLFGSVTSKDIADELNQQGYSIEKKEIMLAEPIKVLGSHKVTIRLGDGLDAEIPVSVERKDGKTSEVVETETASATEAPAEQTSTEEA